MQDHNPQPVDGAVVPRFAGIATFMRLPAVASAAGLDIALVGIPWDGGTTNRAGARHGPREIRNQSSLMRRVHHVSGTEPFSIARIADVGDVSVNPIDLRDALKRIEQDIGSIVKHGAAPLIAGGDHLTTLPVLRAVAHSGPVGMIHFDAHSDTNDTYFGDNPYTHGTPFRRAVEEGLLDPKRVVQIGIRGSIYDPNEPHWARTQGIKIVYMEDFVRRGIEDVMREARSVAGDGTDLRLVRYRLYRSLDGAGNRHARNRRLPDARSASHGPPSRRGRHRGCRRRRGFATVRRRRADRPRGGDDHVRADVRDGEAQRTQTRPGASVNSPMLWNSN